MTSTELQKLFAKTNPNDYVVGSINVFQSSVERETKLFLKSLDSLSKRTRSSEIVLIAIVQRNR